MLSGLKYLRGMFAWILGEVQQHCMLTCLQSEAATALVAVSLSTCCLSCLFLSCASSILTVDSARSNTCCMLISMALRHGSWQPMRSSVEQAYIQLYAGANQVFQLAQLSCQISNLKETKESTRCTLRSLPPRVQEQANCMWKHAVITCTSEVQNTKNRLPMDCRTTLTRPRTPANYSMLTLS